MPCFLQLRATASREPQRCWEENRRHSRTRLPQRSSGRDWERSVCAPQTDAPFRHTEHKHTFTHRYINCNHYKNIWNTTYTCRLPPFQIEHVIFQLSRLFKFHFMYFNFLIVRPCIALSAHWTNEQHKRLWLVHFDQTTPRTSWRINAWLEAIRHFCWKSDFRCLLLSLTKTKSIETRC